MQWGTFVKTPVIEVGQFIRWVKPNGTSGQGFVQGVSGEIVIVIGVNGKELVNPSWIRDLGKR